MAITPDAQSIGPDQVAGTSLTWTHTCGASANFLRVGVSWNDPTVNVSSVTYNSVTLTPLTKRTGNGRACQLFYLVNPATGSAHAIAVTFSASTVHGGGAASYNGVYTSNPVSGETFSTDFTTTPTVTVTSEAGDLVVDVVCATVSVAVDGSQTEEWNSGAPTNGAVTAGSREAGAATVTMSYTMAENAWVMAAVNLHASAVTAADLEVLLYEPAILASLIGGSGVAWNYSTDFPTVESVLSEGGIWRTGLQHGLDWTDPRVGANGVHGTQTGPYTIPEKYNDSIACLVGTFGPTQDAQGIVRTTNQQAGQVFEEVELLLRFSISANSARGYEVLFAVSKQYVDIVRWNGPFGNFTSLASGSIPTMSTGDIVRATISGSTITAYRNGEQVLQATDSTWTDGNPGIGLFFETDGSGGANTDYGLTHYQVETS